MGIEIAEYSEHSEVLYELQSALTHPFVVSNFKLYLRAVHLVGGGIFDRIWFLDNEDETCGLVLDIKNPSLDSPYVLEYYEGNQNTFIGSTKTKTGIVKILNTLDFEEVS